MAVLKTPIGRTFLWKTALTRLASVELTLVCLGLAMALVVAGTLAQVRIGPFEAQKEFFNSWWVTTRIGEFKCPVFPGGLTVGALWLGALIASFITRFRLNRKDLGIFVSHAGLILLLIGQLISQVLSRETQLPIAIGQSKNYSEDTRTFELAVINPSDAQFDTVTSIPHSYFSVEGEIQPPRLPFTLVIRRFFHNSELAMMSAGTPSLATQGVGTRVAVQEIPPASNDDVNTVSAYVEVREGQKSLGTWLVSSGLGAPQSFRINGTDYTMAFRPKRHYFPFTLTLKEFHHDIYPGTDIPKNFSSLIELSHPAKAELRQALIYMNHPLRYEGKTFYQASFGEGNTVSVFQVVENPVAIAPYLFCSLVIIGLLIQFLSHLLVFARKRR